MIEQLKPNLHDLLDSAVPRDDVSLPTLTRKQLLPFNDLSWENFERLCTRLIQTQDGVIDCHRYGVRGDYQAGIDILAHRRTPDGTRERWCFQCKRWQKMTAGQLREIVAKFSFPADHYVVLLSVEATAPLRKVAADLPAVDLWDAEDLSNALKPHPHLVEEFFGPHWREAFCGPPIRPAEFDPPKWIVPFARNPDFVGREHDLKRLHEALTEEGPVGIKPAGLTGVAGIGKTQLAVEYAYHYKDHYPDGVFWVTADHNLSPGLAELGTQLDPATIDRPRGHQVRAAAEYFNRYSQSLLILDNLTDPADLNRPLAGGVVPSSLACRVLFTTRRRDFVRFHSIELTVLSEDAAMNLLLRHPGRRPVLDTTHEEHGDAQQICAVVGYLPLALELAGAHLARRPEAPLRAYREDLERRGALPVLDDPRGGVRVEDLATRHTAAVGATLQEQCEMIESEDARLVLCVAGQLAEAAIIPIPRLGLLAGLSAQDEGFFGSPLASAVKDLADISLVEMLTEDRIRLHPLVREFAANLTLPEDTSSFREGLAANLKTSYMDIATMEDHWACRGIGALEGDLLVALEVVGGRTSAHSPVRQSITSLLRLIQREAHHLRGSISQEHPAALAWHVHKRAVQMGLADLAARATQRLMEDAAPHLLLEWCASRESRALVRTLSGHGRGVLAVAITPDGERVISGSYDGTLKIWDTATGEEVRTLSGHEGGVLAVAITPDGERVISGSSDRTLKIWDLTPANEITTITLDAAARCLALGQNGRTVISGDAAGNIYCWQYVPGRLERDSTTVQY